MSTDAPDPIATALLAAVKAGDVAALRAADKGALTKLCDEDGRTALSVAAAKGSKEVVQALLDAGAAESAVAAAGHAAFSGHAEALALLLAAGGAEAAKAPDPLSGMTPLMLASLKGHAACVAQLLDAAAPLDATDSIGRTVLMLAATGGSVETVRMLAAKGAAVDETSKDGRTALMWAVISHRPLVVEALAQLGADPTLREKELTDLVTPGAGNEEPRSALDHAKLRHGKDPVLNHIAAYLKEWLKLREEGGAAAPPPAMPEPAWITYARETVAREAEEEKQKLLTAADDVSTGGGGAGGGGDDGDIWGDDDEPPSGIEEIVADAPPVAAAASATPVTAEGFTACSSFAGKREGQTFKTGPHGLGYYVDEKAAPATAQAPAPAPAAEKQVKFAPAAPAKETLGLAGAQPLVLEPSSAPAAAAAAPAAPSNLDELD